MISKRNLVSFVPNSLTNFDVKLKFSYLLSFLSWSFSKIWNFPLAGAAMSTALTPYDLPSHKMYREKYKFRYKNSDLKFTVRPLLTTLYQLSNILVHISQQIFWRQTYLLTCSNRRLRGLFALHYLFTLSFSADFSLVFRFFVCQTCVNFMGRSIWPRTIVWWPSWPMPWPKFAWRI